MQPEQASFDLDFSYYDHRFAMNVLCMYLAKERRENLRGMSYVRADGTVDKLETGVPKSWETLSKIPTGGTFKARYVCAPENRKFVFRKQQLEAFGYWDCGDLSETEVRWWYTMSDVPVDIIHLITFIHNKWDVPSPSKAFKHIVGDKDACPFSAFENAFAKRFELAEPTDTTRRLQDIFRYFDDSGDGKVSINEWMVLDQIWEEVRLSVQEFSQFLERTFNEKVESLWELFDKDKSGDVSKKEWTQAVASLGYFGPANLIYAFLDPTGKGSLGPSSFTQLSGFERSILGVDTRSISRH
jgi:Ca2+-binding EF-hand superfamily protein